MRARLSHHRHYRRDTSSFTAPLDVPGPPRLLQGNCELSCAGQVIVVPVILQSCLDSNSYMHASAIRGNQSPGSSRLEKCMLVGPLTVKVVVKPGTMGLYMVVRRYLS